MSSVFKYYVCACVFVFRNKRNSIRFQSPILILTCFQVRPPNSKDSNLRSLVNKNLSFLISPVFTDRFASLTYEKTQNCKSFPTNIVQSICDSSFASDMPRSLVFREARCQENFQSFKQKQKCSWT